MTNRGRVLYDNVYDLNAILHPGSVYDHPRDGRRSDASREEIDLGVLGLGCRRCHVVPLAESSARPAPTSVHRRHSGSSLRTRQGGSATTRRETGSAAIDLPNLRSGMRRMPWLGAYQKHSNFKACAG